MDWTKVVPLVSLLIGATGLTVGIINYRKARNIAQSDYQRFWGIAKHAYAIMWAIEKIQPGLIQAQGIPPETIASWGRAHELSKAVVRVAIENLFLHHKVFTEDEFQYLVRSEALQGYMLECFKQMRLHPPAPSASEPPALTEAFRQAGGGERQQETQKFAD
jgi:hypothetical protein